MLLLSALPVCFTIKWDKACFKHIFWYNKDILQCNLYSQKCCVILVIFFVVFAPKLYYYFMHINVILWEKDYVFWSYFHVWNDIFSSQTKSSIVQAARKCGTDYIREFQHAFFIVGGIWITISLNVPVTFINSIENIQNLFIELWMQRQTTAFSPIVFIIMFNNFRK